MNRDSNIKWHLLVPDHSALYEGQMSSVPELMPLEFMPNGEKEILFNLNWRVSQGDIQNGQSIDLDIRHWELVDLPHDFSISMPVSTDFEAESGFYPGGIRWYRKNFILPSDYLNHHIALAFDGIYQIAEIFINGRRVAEHFNGYTPFTLNITDFLYQDGQTENQIAIKVTHQTPSSRWYSGSGIYRDVKLIVTDKLHFTPMGITISTPQLAFDCQCRHNVEVKVKLQIENDHSIDQSYRVLTQIFSPDGECVGQSESDALFIKGNEHTQIDQTLFVKHPKLWSIAHPHLYQVKSILLMGTHVYDWIASDYGFRYFHFDRHLGFNLNGQNIKLKGVNLHHDNGALGAVANRNAIREKLQMLKEMGANAIRTSHNPTSQHLIDEANQQGFLIIEEAFDGWDCYKNGNIYDFSRYFHTLLGEENARVLSHAQPNMTWAEYSLRSMIHRGKNAPSIIMWSIGNEIGEGTSQNIEHYNQLGKELVSWVQNADPSRPMTIGANWPDDFHPIYQAIIDAGGVMGYNYLTPDRMEQQRKLFPKAKVYGSETTSAIHSRGEYATKGRNATTFQITEYDNDQARVGWGHSASTAWAHAIEYDWNAGIFVWTGYDYIGEPTPWNGISPGSISGKGPVPNSSYFGIIDTAGFPKDTYWLYRSMWKEDSYTLNLMSTWNFDEIDHLDGKVQVDVYTNAAKVELYLNDKLIGEAVSKVHQTPAGHTYHRFEGNKPYPCFMVEWQPGTLSVKGYDQAGQEITHLAQGRISITSSGMPNQLYIQTKTKELQADGQSLAYLEVTLLDDKQNIVTNNDREIRFELLGSGQILGVDNGNSADPTAYHTQIRKTFHGKVMVIVKADYQVGEIQLSAHSEGLISCEISLTVTHPTYQSELGIRWAQFPKYYAVSLGQKLELPHVIPLYNAKGLTGQSSVEWELIPPVFNRLGLYSFLGTVKETNSLIRIWVKVIHPIVTIQNAFVRTYVNQKPILPNTLTAYDTEGNPALEIPVIWNPSSLNLSQVGEQEIKGQTFLFEKILSPKAKILIEAEQQQINLTKEAQFAHGYRTRDKKLIDLKRVNITLNDGSPLDHRTLETTWNTWNTRLDDHKEAFYLQISWPEKKCFSNINLWHFTLEDRVYLPGDGKIEFEYWNSETQMWQFQPASNITQVSYLQGETTYGLIQPITTDQLRIWIKQPKEGQAIGISQVEILDNISSRALGTTCKVSSINQTRKKQRELEIITEDFSIPTILTNKNGQVQIQVTSEDGKNSQTYLV